MAGARNEVADTRYMSGPQTTPLREDMALTVYGGKPKARAVLTRMWQEVLALAAGLIGVAPILSVMPEPVRQVPGRFNPILAELGTMRFQWQRRSHVCASKFIGRFGGQATTLKQGLAETIAACRATG